MKINGVDVLIADDAKLWADRSVVDYVNDKYEEGFTIHNDYATDCDH